MALEHHAGGAAVRRHADRRDTVDQDIAAVRFFEPADQP
jgi:hypothetical protein